MQQNFTNTEGVGFYEVIVFLSSEGHSNSNNLKLAEKYVLHHGINIYS